MSSLQKCPDHYSYIMWSVGHMHIIFIKHYKCCLYHPINSSILLIHCSLIQNITYFNLAIKESFFFTEWCKNWWASCKKWCKNQWGWRQSKWGFTDSAWFVKEDIGWKAIKIYGHTTKTSHPVSGCQGNTIMPSSSPSCLHFWGCHGDDRGYFALRPSFNPRSSLLLVFHPSPLFFCISPISSSVFSSVAHLSFQTSFILAPIKIHCEFSRYEKLFQTRKRSLNEMFCFNLPSIIGPTFTSESSIFNYELYKYEIWIQFVFIFHISSL